MGLMALLDSTPKQVLPRGGSWARPVTVGGAVARFTIGSVVAIAVVVVGGFFALRSVAIDDAQRETEIRVRQLGQLVEQEISDGVLTQEPRALEHLDNLVTARVLSETVVRVKIWSAEGRIVYSDEPALVGRTFGLSDDHRRSLREGGAAVELRASTARRTLTTARMVSFSRPTRRSGPRPATRSSSRSTSGSTRRPPAGRGCCGPWLPRCWPGSS